MFQFVLQENQKKLNFSVLLVQLGRILVAAERRLWPPDWLATVAPQGLAAPRAAARPAGTHPETGNASPGPKAAAGRQHVPPGPPGPGVGGSLGQGRGAQGCGLVAKFWITCGMLLGSCAYQGVAIQVPDAKV